MSENVAERMEFKTELKQLMDIIVHSLYSHKEVFLRELVSNACDAIDKARFEALTRPEVLEGGSSDWKIKLVADKAAGTLTVSDNGIGMGREEIVENLGTIARSGTQAFIKNLEQADIKDRPDLIGQFGVGFYSAFMVADRVTVVSRPAGATAADGVKWESDGQGSFVVEPVEKPSRGTDVILHLKDDEKEFLDEWRLRELARKFSDFVEHPIVMDVEKEGETVDATGKKNKVVAEETLNRRQAIWLRPKNEIAEDEYKEFYKHLTRHWDEPAATIHYSAEGTTEFKALLFVPTEKPFNFDFDAERKSGLSLYIRRVFIMSDCEKLLPPWLRFVKGVVDAADLPLNVSRETIQENRLLDKIRKNLAGKVLSALEAMKKDERAKYEAFFKAFGSVIKEGVAGDPEYRDKLAELILVQTTATEPGKTASLREIVERMPEGQDALYYLIGERRDLIEKSPVLEGFRAKNWEVILLTEPIDEWVMQMLPEFAGKKLRAADKGDLPADDAKKEEREKQAEAFKDYLGFLKEKLGDAIEEARVSARLTESAACLVSDEGAYGAHMERLMKRMGHADELPENKRVLELNPGHPIVQALRALYEKDHADPRLEAHGRLLYEQALLAEGSPLPDPKAFMARVGALMANDLKV